MYWCLGFDSNFGSNFGNVISPKKPTANIKNITPNDMVLPYANKKHDNGGRAFENGLKHLLAPVQHPSIGRIDFRVAIDFVF